MRLSKPRIEPVDMDRLDDEQQAVVERFLDITKDKVSGGKVLNIFRTLLHSPKALTAFLVWGNHIMSRRNSLPERDRELVILRVGWLCKSGYEWTQHKRIGLNCGLTEGEIERIKQGPDAPEWSERERNLLRAADDLHANHHLSDENWAALEELGDQGRMDLVFTVGQYTQVSMILNSFGIQVEDGWDVDPDLKA